MAETGTRTARDSWLAPALLIAGVVAMGYASLHRGGSQDMLPGIEGAVTVGVLAPILLLLHGLGFAEMLKAAIPIWIVQFVATAAVGGPAISGLGIDLTAIGAIGVVVRAIAMVSSAAPSPALAPSRSRSRPRPDAPSYGLIHPLSRH
jgi:hypothetical protein